MHSSLFTAMAQQKLFTLEDLNFGGKNYRNMQPRNLWLTWWGDQLMYQYAEEGGTIDAKGKRRQQFNLETVNFLLTASSDVEKRVIHSAMNARYPYPGQPLVLLSNREQQLLFNFKTEKIEWSQSVEGATVSKWSPQSRALAYKKADQQLYVRFGEAEKQLTTDGSREIVYGESVHRNEFGIDEGLFWSPDGQRLAFYRMDQSMVADYPQVDIFPSEATYEPDKYPMAGMTSHKVTVGIYDLKTQKTAYLKAGDPTDRYFTNIAWSPDAKTVYMLELNRAQNDCRLVSYDA
ncbi:MAG: DPP IV N-terminal domain-containing protein, partial [Prevotella sp.]|nr:DPP IV N-terminal domain-containing protein [Prevotella sp.]